MENMRHGEITSRIIGAAMKVHTKLGSGFLEVIYQRALAMELQSAGLDHVREAVVDIHYNGEVIGERRVDFIVAGLICVEIKAMNQLEPGHISQVKNYLNVFRMDIGLLINFGSSSLEFKRIEHWERTSRTGMQ